MSAETVRTLLEGLRGGDLAGHVRPRIQLDVHAPRIDPGNVVVTFCCDSADVAFDLARFVFLGPVPAVDVDFTDLPDGRLRYYVYVELPRSPDLTEHLPRLLADVERLTGPQRWTIVGQDGRTWPDAGRAALDLLRRDRAGVEARLAEIAGSVGLALGEDRRVRIGPLRYRVVAAGPAHVLMDAIERSGAVLRLDEAAASESMRAVAVTGGCAADAYGPWLVLSRGDVAVVLREG